MYPSDTSLMYPSIYRCQQGPAAQAQLCGALLHGRQNKHSLWQKPNKTNTLRGKNKNTSEKDTMFTFLF